LVALLPQASRAAIQRWVEGGGLLLSGKPATRSANKVQTGQTMILEIPEITSSEILPEDIPLTVHYEDDDLLVVQKPRGMPVHPSAGHLSGTLVNALLHHCKGQLSGVGGVERPGIVHRLDMDTTGLLMVAKNDFTHRGLQDQIQSRDAKRRYAAIVWGTPGFPDAVIDAPIGRHPQDRKKMAVHLRSTQGVCRKAVTKVIMREPLGPCSLWECRLDTGRTHQIRVHCQFAGYPVVGDTLYGGIRRTGDVNIDAAVAALGGQALHAYRLAFRHPRTGKIVDVRTPLPEPMRNLLTVLRKLESHERPSDSGRR
jgi:23S rRNA pseudouridine1911/1915/1917 synthase